jgi:hypothetical protein
MASDSNKRVFFDLDIGGKENGPGFWEKGLAWALEMSRRLPNFFG